jgi:hypothetical protein
VEVTRLLFFRAPNGRTEHFTADKVVTLCGVDATCGARYSAADVRVDHKIRPLCEGCRSEAAKEKKGAFDPWADDDHAW